MPTRYLKSFSCLVLAVLICTGTASALPLGEREAQHFAREAEKIFREIIFSEVEQTGAYYRIDLTGQTIRKTPVQGGSVTFKGFSEAQFAVMRGGAVDTAKLLEGDGVEVEATITADAIKGIIEREIARVNKENRIFDPLNLSFQNGQVRVTGQIDFRKIPGNVLSFLSTGPTPFSAVIKPEQNGSRIDIKVIDAKINDQPMADDSLQQILNWLNPVWDFSILPFKASLESYSISPAGVSFSGTIYNN